MLKDLIGVVARLSALLPFALVLTPSPAAPPVIPPDWYFDGANRTLEGKPAPEIDVESWIGSAVKLSELRGKVVVLDFWATWCGPCMAAIPENVELMDKHKSDGKDGDLVIVGVHDSNAGFDRAPQVVKEKKINYPVAKDKNGASTKAYNLQFWPTYVVIDRTGVVRASGLVPNKVGKVVEMLLAEGGGASADGKPVLGAEYFAGGAKRPSALRATEGKPMPALKAQAWANGPLDAARMRGAVVAVHFWQPGGGLAAKQIADFAKLETELAPQGVVFVAIADAGSDFKKAQEGLAATKSTMPLAHDMPPEAASAPAQSAESESKTRMPRPPGLTAQAFGVQFMPATVLIDRNGIVRAAGIRLEKAKELIEKLLAEQSK